MQQRRILILILIHVTALSLIVLMIKVKLHVKVTKCCDACRYVHSAYHHLGLPHNACISPSSFLRYVCIVYILCTISTVT